MKIAVLTGSIASGKSTAATLYRKQGVPIIDCDQIAKKQSSLGGISYYMIRLFFGKSVLNEDKSINRAKLGSIIFNDPQKRALLNHITHPFVKMAIVFQLIKYFIMLKTLVIVDVPLFFEVNMDKSWLFARSTVILVSVRDDLQKQRLMARNSFTDEEATSRINSQIPVKEKEARSHIVLRNDKTVDDLNDQIIESMVTLTQ